MASAGESRCTEVGGSSAVQRFRAEDCVAVEECYSSGRALRWLGCTDAGCEGDGLSTDGGVDV